MKPIAGFARPTGEQNLQWVAVQACLRRACTATHCIMRTAEGRGWSRENCIDSAISNTDTSHEWSQSPCFRPSNSTLNLQTSDGERHTYKGKIAKLIKPQHWAYLSHDVAGSLASALNTNPS